MQLFNPWVGYLERSHLQIKNSVLQRLGEAVPEITDHSESNILVIIISIFSGVAEMLNYYIDNMAREAFITTARRYSSVVKHTRLIDYRIKAMIPASVDIQLSFKDANGDLINNDVVRYIPKGTIFKTENNVEFISIQDVYIPTGIKVYSISTQQKTFNDNMLIGVTDGTDDQVFSVGSNYVNDSLYLEVGGEIWELVNTLGRSTPEDKHFIVDISVDKIAYIKFGDNINGKKPGAGLELIGDYYTSQGLLGNVDANTIKNSDFNFIIPGSVISSVGINNNLKAVAGTDYEGIERIRRSAPLHLRTLERAVTKQDYIDTAILAPGVDKATVDYNCGKFVDIYISPNGGGIAQSALLQTTKNYVEERKMITTFINVAPAGESYIVLKISATAKFRRDGIQTKNDIINALLEKYNYTNSDVNRKIRKSDVIALIDNLEKVDFLNIDYMYLKPYLRPKNHTISLIHTLTINPGASITNTWRIQFDGNYMRLLKNNIHMANLVIDTSYTDPENNFTILISPNAYEVGNEWVFKTYPFNQNIETDDFSVPVLNESDLTVTVTEQLSIQ